jgi:anion-transporting  ArsA/GET3 family ATPase
VELGQTSFFESYFETRGIGYDPVEVIRDVHIALYNPADCLREYVLHYLKVPKLYDIFFQNKVMKAFLNAAPALAELSLLGKLTSHLRGIKDSEYDVYVVDCFSTGHALALLRAPRGLSSAFRAGPIYEQASEMDAILRDPRKTHFIVVTLPEDMPVNETIELKKALDEEFHPGTEVICNKLMVPPVGRADRDTLLKTIRNQPLREFLEFLNFNASGETANFHVLFCEL